MVLPAALPVKKAFTSGDDLLGICSATDTVAAFSPEQADLAFATFLLKILANAAFTRDRPDRASPRKTKKSGDFPARKPGEPSVTNVIRKIEFHLLSLHMIT